MTVNIVRNWNNWRHVISIAERLSEIDTERGISEVEICDYLHSIEMALGDRPDPITDIQEYATAILCRSLRISLMRRNEN